MARHFLNLKGAQTVATEAFKLTRKAVADVYEAAAMGVIHGEAGLGKTFAVEEALGSWPDVESCWATFPSQPTMRQVTRTLLELLTRVPSARDRFYATGLLLDELACRPRVLVIDEAQRLNRECIECLRHLHDHPATTFALLLVGGDGCWEVLSREPMLRSRIYRRVTFRPLTSREVLDVLPGYHRLYQQADRELLLFIDDNFAHGNFRNWASFTRSALDLLGRRRPRVLDEAIARNVFTLYGGGANAS
jgi:DNA transposition AAA+ family ATPase